MNWTGIHRSSPTPGIYWSYLIVTVLQLFVAAPLYTKYEYCWLRGEDSHKTSGLDYNIESFMVVLPISLSTRLVATRLRYFDE